MAHRPPVEWFLQHLGELTLDERGDAIKEFAAYVKDLEAVALKKPYGVSRMIEDSAFALGVLLMGLKVAAEILEEMGFVKVPAEAEGAHGHWPIGLFLFAALLIAPKTLGRITAGKLWSGLGDGVSKLIARGRPAAPGEKDQ